MFNARTVAVIKREIKARVLNKAFILMTLLMPALMFGLIGFQAFLLTFKEEKVTTLEIVCETTDMLPLIKAGFDSAEVMKKDEFVLNFSVQDTNAFNSYIEQKKPDLLANKINGLIYVPGQAAIDKKLAFYSSNPNNNNITLPVARVINLVLIDQYFFGKDVSRADIDYVRKGVEFDRYRLSKKAGVKEEGYGNMILAFVLTFLLYLGLLLMGAMMMRSVVEEKNNRIVELLLSSVDSRELMIGKIIGTGFTGLLQMSIWTSPVMFLSLNIFVALPPELIVDIDFSQILIFLINFFVGLITFLGLFAMVGAIFDNEQDAQSGVWPVTMLVLIPFYVTFTMMNDPSNIIAAVCSMLPFFSIIVMPARMTLIDVPNWQLLLAFVINVLTMLGTFSLAGRIYRVGILMTGKKPTWAEVSRWVRYSY